MKDIDQKGIEFLNRLYKDMYKSEDVMHGIDERYIGNKVDNISRYIDRMQDLHERVALSGRPHDLDLLKQFYYRKYVIREEDIPESYFEHHKKSCIDRGEEFTVEKRQGIINAVINDQKRSLDNWINYFVSSDSSYIPMWAKYWAFQGMLTFGTYDKKIEGYCKRSKSTTSPFIDLNLEALGMSIDLLLKVLNKEEIDDKQLEVLVQGGSFGKIYSYITTKLLSKTSNVSKSNQGKWIKYERDSDYVPLVKSLQGYNTGWSTAGEGWAMMYLSKGDNYVYYTYNEKGEAVVPRIAIKMNGNQISEIRGIKEWQDLEPEMVEIVEKKLEEFSDKNEYKKKVSDMTRLTTIYQKFKRHESLSKDDLKFLYEIDDRIEGFVDKKDSRIDEIIMNRDKISDLNNIFDGIDVFEGNLDFKYLEVANGLKLPKVLNGNLNLSGLKTAEGLELPEELNGDLNLSGLKTAEGLKLPRILKGNLDLSGLTTAEGLKLPEELTGSLSLVSLTDAQNIEFPEKFNGGLLLNSLKNISDFCFPKELNGGLWLNSLVEVDVLQLPETLNGGVFLSSLTTVKQMVFPMIINGSIGLNSLTSASGVIFPEILNGYLSLESLKDANGLKLPKIARTIYLNSLISLEGAVIPEEFEKIYLANGIVVTPENIHEYVNNVGTLK